MKASGAEAWLLGDGRLHLQHGPIDLVIEVSGAAAGRNAAYVCAARTFASVLEALAVELPLLRRMQQPGGAACGDACGPVANRMLAAVRPHAGCLLSPMICVAGAVADHLLQAILACGSYSRVSVNNGGDIALYLGDNATTRIGLCSPTESAVVDGHLYLSAIDQVGGIATSGWRGRSHSLGIADAVTVLAATSAAADVAATLIANAVDVPGSSQVQRVPACSLEADSDLQWRPVTIAVGHLPRREREQAMTTGVALAELMLQQGLIRGACVRLQGDVVVVGAAAFSRAGGCSGDNGHPSATGSLSGSPATVDQQAVA